MNAAQTTEQQRKKRVLENEKKWTPTLMEAGWTAIPSVIIERQLALGLDAVDLNILLHLAKYWWTAGNLPHPSKKAIAECMRVHVSTVQRHIARMEKDGLIKRIPQQNRKKGQQPNRYDLTGLIETATPYANEAIDEKKKKQKEAVEKRTRTRLKQ